MSNAFCLNFELLRRTVVTLRCARIANAYCPKLTEMRIWSREFTNGDKEGLLVVIPPQWLDKHFEHSLGLLCHLKSLLSGHFNWTLQCYIKQ